MLNARSLILGLVRPVRENMRLVIVRLAVRNMLILLFQTVIYKTAKVVWIVTVSQNTKLKSILVTDF